MLYVASIWVVLVVLGRYLGCTDGIWVVLVLLGCLGRSWMVLVVVGRAILDAMVGIGWYLFNLTVFGWYWQYSGGTGV